MSDKEVIENKQNNIQENPFLLNFALLIHFTAMFGSKRVLQSFFFLNKKKKATDGTHRLTPIRQRKKN